MIPFLISPGGRTLRTALGLILIAYGVLVLRGVPGAILAVAGMAPVALAVTGRCVLEPPRGDLARPRVPRLIWRNTLLLATTQALVSSGGQLVPTLGAIIVERMLGSMALAGLPSSLSSVARLIVAYPIGWVMDRYGRRTGLLLGLSLSLIGAVGMGVAVARGSFDLFLTALLIFGFGAGASGQLRTAAADMYPASRRAQGLGYVLTGSLVGAFGGPVLIGAAQSGSAVLHSDPISLAWLLVPIVIVPGMVLVLRVRPDPQSIGANLERYYPEDASDSGPTVTSLPAGASLRTWLGNEPLRVGFLATFAGNGIMVMMMALTPLAMEQRGSALTMISLAVSIHVASMYGLSIPLGNLADRFGRRQVIVAGLVLLAAGPLLVALGAGFWVSTAGLALVGLGWSCANVAVTALIADAVPPEERSRAIGVNDSIGATASIVLPLVGGPLAVAAGFPGLAVLAAALTVVVGSLAIRGALPQRA